MGRRLRGSWLLLLLLPTLSWAQIRLSSESLEAYGVALHDFKLELRPGAEGHGLTVSAAAVDLQGLAQRSGAVEVSCQLLLEEQGQRCDGELRIEGETLAFQLQLDEEATRVAVDQEGLQLAARLPTESDTIELELKGLPLGLLRDRLPALNAALGQLSGRLESSLELELEPLSVRGPIQVDTLDFDTPDGTIAGAGIGLAGLIDARYLGDDLQLITGLSIQGGEALLGPVYLEIPASGIELDLDLQWAQSGAITVRRLQLIDPGVLHSELSLALDAEGILTALEVARMELQLDPGLSRYLDSPLSQAGFAGLAGEGQVQLQMRHRPGRVPDFDVSLEEVQVADASGRLQVEGLNGRVALGYEVAAAQGLSWRRMALYRLNLGAAEAQLERLGGGLRLQEPMVVPLLGGQLTLERLLWRPGDSALGAFGVAMALDELSLGALTEALEWPRFPGILSGRIPSVRFEAGVLQFDGLLQMSVFDGAVEIDGLRLERPFGVLPTVAGDIRARGLDLSQLTQTFEFGEIRGRMDMDVLGLRLVDWMPVAFDADLRSVPRSGERQRLSQRAVSSLTSIGGGGLALGQTILRVFETFGYDKLGLKCRLRNHVCQMDGVESANGGYYIVKGSGLPQINVIGFQRNVDWPVLLSRLRAATGAAGPTTQ